MPKSFETLPDYLVEALKKEVIVSMITVTSDSEPQVSAVSWVQASEDGKKVAIATGHKGSSITNLENNPKITLGVIANESYYSIKGIATVSDVEEKSMKYRVITVDVKEVEDAIFYGGKIVQEPVYEKTYDPKLIEKLDNEVNELLTEYLK
ncbi:pyridoxamine 5'-phosphate oxidase family protein [Bacillus suaedaesalsae]|uniref:Pyridoxamine 5'-phosphate oxidase family protein n=1 Tax=Bacillus suaedaesalsae TaxID=2810349 RepID=A0ABS2DHN4_9BACI|nr:pyridoxamine 5'-phosphate oxidase family protein [Bacillus suaedaesalsae]MBM6617980.1 pyridoxamine 5'-phosphate oxidase family protein [Bacillus suaedaesalsae]